MQALVEKDWLAFGHPFSERAGMPSFSGNGNMPLELSRQSSSPNITTSSSMRQSSGSYTPQSPISSNTQHLNNYSPIFLQVRNCCYMHLFSFFKHFIRWTYSNTLINTSMVILLILWIMISFDSGLIVSHNYYGCTLLHLSSRR